MDVTRQEPEWRTIEEVLAADPQGEIAEYLDSLPDQEGNTCRTTTLIDEQPDLADDALARFVRAKELSRHAATGTVLSKRTGVGPGGLLGTLVEIDLTEQFRERIPRSPEARSTEIPQFSDRAYYFLWG
jgi:hypothetical protein